MERFREWVCEMQDEQTQVLVVYAVSSTLKEEDIERISVSVKSQNDWWQAFSDLEGAFFILIYQSD